VIERNSRENSVGRDITYYICRSLENIILDINKVSCNKIMDFLAIYKMYLKYEILIEYLNKLILYYLHNSKVKSLQ
jgi:hypothetical protein